MSLSLGCGLIGFAGFQSLGLGVLSALAVLRLRKRSVKIACGLCLFQLLRTFAWSRFRSWNGGNLRCVVGFREEKFRNTIGRACTCWPMLYLVLVHPLPSFT